MFKNSLKNKPRKRECLITAKDFCELGRGISKLISTGIVVTKISLTYKGCGAFIEYEYFEEKHARKNK